MEVSIKIKHTQMECEGVDSIHVAQDMVQWRVLMNAVLNLPVP